MIDTIRKAFLFESCELFFKPKKTCTLFVSFRTLPGYTFKTNLMKLFLLAVLFLNIMIAGVAQTIPQTVVFKVRKNNTKDVTVASKVKYDSRKVEVAFLVVEEPAIFKGGDINTFNVWVSQNIKYPQLAVENGIDGKVYVQFVVNQNGNVEDVKVLRSAEQSLDQEAVRVIKSSPKWTPPKQGGRPVKQLFTLPVVFKLQE